jgi:Tfp pilus assembly protein PilN
MITINLLPRLHTLPLRWLSILCISFIAVVSLHIHYQSLMTEKQQQITRLKQVIYTMKNDKTNPQKHHFNLKKYLPVQLYALIQQLPVTIPIGLYLTQLSLVKGGIKVTGYTENISLLSTWMSNLTNHHFNTLLQTINHDKNNPYFPVKFCIWIKF